MPALARRYTAYARDLSGLGDSSGSPPSYDKATLARYVHTLVADRLGLRDLRLVGHDLGAAVAFRYAVQYTGEVTKLAYLDLPLPGPAIDARQYLSWHIAFHSQPAIPEAVVSDDVREYRSLFYPQVAFGGTGVRRNRDGVALLRGRGRRVHPHLQPSPGPQRWFRPLPHPRRGRTRQHRRRPDCTPTLLMTAQGLLASERQTLEPRDHAITDAVEVPQADHWLIEENPNVVTTHLLGFLG